jgi:chromosome segregation ATPase
MKRSRDDSLLARFRKSAGNGEAATDASSVKNGIALEQAYRDLLLENQVLVESNRRLHERLARAEGGQAESPAAQQLIRTQRNALADRSHQLREATYANKELRRRYAKLQEETRRLAEAHAQRATTTPRLESELAASQKQVRDLQEELRRVKVELATLTDRYYQLQARIDPAVSADRVVNGDF